MQTAASPAIDRELIECEIERIPIASLPDVILNEDRIRHRVKRGIEALNRFMPGWQDRINLNELAMESCLKCILGQLFGEYGKEPHDDLFGDRPGAFRGETRASHGFECECFLMPYSGLTAEMRRTEYATLGRIWTEEILALVSQADEH